MNSIYDAFESVDKASWMARLEKDLKGVTFQDLATKDNNNLTIHPFYTAEDLSRIGPSYAAHPDWDIITKIVVLNVQSANDTALQLLSAGVNGLHFVLNENVDFNILLNDINLPFIHTRFSITGAFDTNMVALQQYVQQAQYNWDELPLFIQYDPVITALYNNEVCNWDSWSTYIKKYNGVYTFCVDGTIYKNAGANSVYTLALIASHCNEYLHHIASNNLQEYTQKITINYTVSTLFFEEIAAIRALKQMLDTLLQQYNMSSCNIHLHIETSSIYKSSLDIYSNLLRDTIAGMSAVLGGCTSLSITAFDYTVAATNPFGYRMSKNIQLLYKEEAYLNKVNDVAKGSYYIEHLTQAIAQKAWRSFQSIEQNGGLLAQQNVVFDSIQHQANQLIKDYKDGKKILIGVNKFPNPNDNTNTINISLDKKHILDPIQITPAILAEK